MSIRLKKIFNAALVVAAIFCGVLFISENQLFSKGVQKGLSICANSVIPSLFLFMILSQFIALSELGGTISKILSPITVRIYNLPKNCGSAIIMGFIGGYPAAAKMISSEVKTGRLSKKSAQRLLCSCVNAGPAFVIAAIGVGVYKNAKIGAELYAAQVISSIIIGFIMSFCEKRGEKPKNIIPSNISYSSAFVRSVASASESMLHICGYVVFFSAMAEWGIKSGVIERISGVTEKIIPFATKADITAMICGLFEASTGSFLSINPVVTAFILSFGGMSVIFQIADQFSEVDISIKRFILTRPIHGTLTAMLFCLITKIFPTAINTGNFGNNQAKAVLISDSVYVSIALMLSSVIFLFTVSEKKKL